MTRARAAAPLPVCSSFLIALALLLGSTNAAAAGTWDDIRWFDGAAGYARAVSLAESSGAPVLVYFYADWCPYCRELNEGLLGDPQVQSQVGKMLAVRVDAEAGPDERSLAAHFQVRGYPALFLYTASQGGSYTPLRRTVGSPSGVRLKTPQEFVETLRTGR